MMLGEEKGEKCKNVRMLSAVMMREMQIAVEYRKEAERKWKKNKMKSWLIRRKIDDDDGGEMLNEKSDIELNVVDVIGEMDLCRHESRNRDCWFWKL